jgi:DNA-binding transcriptional ArsR family regulator
MNTSAALDVLAALSQNTRLSIFRLLVQHAPKGLPAGEIAHRLHLPKPTLSFHLNVLTAASVVQPRKNGRSISYSPNLNCVSGLAEFLLQNCCGGRKCLPTTSTKPLAK